MAVKNHGGRTVSSYDFSFWFEIHASLSTNESRRCDDHKRTTELSYTAECSTPCFIQSRSSKSYSNDVKGSDG
jgi:hypothetical protein